MIALMLAALLLVAPVLELYERDAESWSGLSYGERVPLLNARLVVKVGQRQRLNPSIKAAPGVQAAMIYLRVPRALVLEPSTAWTTATTNDQSVEVYARIGEVLEGVGAGASEALYFTARAPGVHEIAYQIAARDRKPVVGRFFVTAR